MLPKIRPGHRSAKVAAVDPCYAADEYLQEENLILCSCLTWLRD